MSQTQPLEQFWKYFKQRCLIKTKQEINISLDKSACSTLWGGKYTSFLIEPAFDVLVYVSVISIAKEAIFWFVEDKSATAPNTVTIVHTHGCETHAESLWRSWMMFYSLWLLQVYNFNERFSWEEHS